MSSEEKMSKGIMFNMNMFKYEKKNHGPNRAIEYQ